MPAVLPTSLTRESVGSLTMHIAVFAATTDDADTYASGLPNVVGFWANRTDAPTQEKEGIDVEESSTGNFIFNGGEDNFGVTLYILSRT